MTAAPSPRRSDLPLRALTGLVLILVALFCIVYGKTPFWALLTAAALLMLAEWASLIRAERWQMWIAFVGMLPPLILCNDHLDVTNAAPWICLIATTLAVFTFTRLPKLAMGMLYAGLPTLALFYIQGQYDGIDLAFWTLAIVWATDIGAYFVGRKVGGPRLAPVLSPNKTWAGLIGGTVAAIIAGIGLAHILHLPLRLAAFSGLLALAAQAGDIYESAMKRRAGVKDSGRLLPGHGGVMDRLDGVVPVACIVALIVSSGVLTA
ncbi:MAG TPA: phosphatidate cytidylyltransferase [Sphingomonas sp.]|nr:phosphatidate cytidylyltransferase [Sphingomonas sp.]